MLSGFDAHVAEVHFVIAVQNAHTVKKPPVGGGLQPKNIDLATDLHASIFSKNTPGQ